MNVTNTLARDTGSVLVSKKLSGQVGGFANDAAFPGFPVGYVCALDPADLGNTSAERMLGEVFVTAGADAVTLVDGVPRGWTCAANEGSFVTATNTWLLDSSFAWGTPTITVDGEQQETFLIGATPHRVVVDNPITRQLGTIQIDKAIAEGFDGVVNDGATFGGAYQCSYAIGTDREATYSGTWSVDGEGRATLTGDTQLPYGTTCSVTETTPSDADLVDASWTWGEEIVTAAPAVVSGDGPAAFTVTNTPERVFSTLAITKALTGPTDGFTDPALAVDGSWACVYGGETVASGTWTAPAVGGAATLTPADVQIPVTSRCTVVEDTLDPSVFKDASYTWGAHPADQSATIVAGEVASVTVTNVVERVQGTFTISKLIERGPGVTVQVPGSDVVYSGTYECTYAGVTTGPLPWSIIGEGNSFTAPTQYADSVCTVLSENAPNRQPVVADNSFGWGAHTIGAAVTVTPNATVNVDVTNRVFRSVGSFGVTKVVEGDTVGLPAQPTYSFAWSCTADNGDTYPTDPEDATFTLTAGQQWNPSENIPLGSSCTVTETDIPAPLHPSFTWSTAMSVAGAEGTPGTGDDPSIAFEIPQQSDAGVLVTATNTLTRGLGGFSVTKSVPEGSVVDETMTFTGAFECVGPLAGDEVTGTWGPIAAGETWTSEKNIPLAASCKVTSEERPVWPSGDDHSQQWAGDPDLGTAVVSAVEPATVTVTNATAQVLGSVTWSKVVEGTEDRLAGSTWTLTAPSGDAVTVVDCIEATCREGAFLDQNPAPGEFLLTGLGWGGYTLVEAQAPPGTTSTTPSTRSRSAPTSRASSRWSRSGRSETARSTRRCCPSRVASAGTTSRCSDCSSSCSASVPAR
nr:DUF5979 domain-containing protein [Tessaracoccus coleopterorum]